MILFQREHFFDILKVKGVLVDVLKHLVLLEVHPAEVTPAHAERIPTHMLDVDHWWHPRTLETRLELSVRGEHIL